MKKVFLIGLVILILGAAVFGAGWYLTGGNVGVLNGSIAGVEVSLGDRHGFVGVRGGRSGSAPDEHAYLFNSVQKIVLDESNTSVRVTKSPDRQVHLRCQENDSFYFDIQEQSGTLTLKRIEKDKELFNLGWNTRMETELQVPDDLDLLLETSNSRLTLEGVAARSLEAETSNGSAVCTSCASRGDLSVKTSNGGVTLTDCKAERDLTVKTGNGSVTLTRCGAGTTLEAKTSNSTIAVDGLTAGQRIRLETSNGSVRGTLPGSISDYTVESHTSNGSNSLPESYGRGAVELSVKTSNGSIRLEFDED